MSCTLPDVWEVGAALSAETAGCEFATFATAPADDTPKIANPATAAGMSSILRENMAVSSFKR
jgi:hypothetical protein